MQPRSRSGGPTVAAAGTAIGLALGVLYAWSVIKGGIPGSWGWSHADKALPYSLACMVFALAMVPAGRLQDVLGPRVVATIGGLLTGTGFILAGLAGSSLAGFIVGFGVVTPVGIGFAYSAATPAAVKWFPPERTGLVAGIVVAGFGLAPVWIAPLVSWLLETFADPGDPDRAITRTMIALGAGLLVVVTALAQLLRNPPDARSRAAGTPTRPTGDDRSSRQMLGAGQFYVLWAMYFAGAAAGLTFIGVAQGLGSRSLGERAFLAVVVLAIGNAGGRIVAGVLSDRIGRQATLLGAFLLQASTVLALHLARDGGAGWPVLLAVLLVLGANYGANLALFPSACKDLFGLRHFGVNYGLLFTAWGAAGLVMPWVNGLILDATGTDDAATFIIIGLLLVGAGLTFASRTLARPPRAADVPPARLAA